MSRTVMITGGAGFLAGHLAVRLSANGDRVIAFDSNEPRDEISWMLKKNKVDIVFVKGDVSDFESVKGCAENHGVTDIVHTAFINNIDILANNVPLSVKVNVVGTVNVLETARLLGIKKVIDTSSISVYASKQYEPMDERHPVILPDEGPSLLSYTGCKIAAESLGMHYWKTHGVDFIALRFSAIYGLGMIYPMYIKPIVENAAAGKDTHFDWGKDMRRDYTYVSDCCQGIMLALEKSPKNRIFNISTGAELRPAGVIGEVVSKLNPGVSITFGDIVNEVEANAVKDRGVLSIDKAREELEFVPCYTLEKGTEEYYHAYAEYLKESK